MFSPLFWFFAALTLAFGVGVVVNRNPVASALCLVVSFMGLAALLVGLDAYLLAVLQVLVYAGAVMVLFLFIIMLLDLRAEARRKFNWLGIAGGGLVALGFVGELVFVISHNPGGNQKFPPLQVTPEVVFEGFMSPGSPAVSKPAIKQTLLAASNSAAAQARSGAPAVTEEEEIVETLPVPDAIQPPLELPSLAKVTGTSEAHPLSEPLSGRNTSILTVNVINQPIFSANHRPSGKIDDVREIGREIFTNYNFPLQIVGVLLLVATVGVIILSRRELK